MGAAPGFSQPRHPAGRRAPDLGEDVRAVRGGVGIEARSGSPDPRQLGQQGPQIQQRRNDERKPCGVTREGAGDCGRWYRSGWEGVLWCAVEGRTLAAGHPAILVSRTPSGNIPRHAPALQHQRHLEGRGDGRSNAEPQEWQQVVAHLQPRVPDPANRVHDVAKRQWPGSLAIRGHD